MMNIAKISEVFAQKYEAGEDFTGMFGFDDRKCMQVEQRAYQFYLRGNYEKAQVLLEGLISMNTTRAYPYQLLGEIAFKSCLYSEALALWEKSAQLDGEDIWTTMKLAELNIQFGRLKKAKPLLEKVIACEDRRAMLLVKRATCLKDILDRSETS